MPLEDPVIQRESLHRRGICVVIPTYNNAGTIADVVARTLAQCDDVIVVCDGCTDGTVELLKPFPVMTVVHDRNRGKGAALRSGFRFALEHGFSYAITLDGDGQHFPEDIALMLEASRDNPGALIVGERRNLDESRRGSGSRFANMSANFWFFLQTFRHVNDTQSGFRLYPLKKLGCLSLLSSRYESELELLVFAAWRGVEIAKTPVRVFYPAPEQRVSHFRPVRDFIRIFILNTLLCPLALIYGLPRTLLRFLWRVLQTIFILSVFVIATLFVMTPFSLLYIKSVKSPDKRMAGLHTLIYKYLRTALRLMPGMDFSQSNPSGEDFHKPSVIICNHQSHLDLLPVLALTDKVVFLTADWVWNNPFYGFIIRHAGYLPASRGIESIVPQVRDIMEKGYSVVIYPEGTRSLNCRKIGRFHQGAFSLAESLGADIVPLVLYGTGCALAKHSLLYRPWPVRMDIDARLAPPQQASFGASCRERASAFRKYYSDRYSEIADMIERNV